MATDFDAVYRSDIDPWRYRDSWYEQRKYAITVACLPRERYRLVWEPACSIGVLTRLLAARADRVVASDGSPTAIGAARSGDAPANVEWSVQLLPADPGIRGADLVILSEILYYLDDSDRQEVVRRAHDVLAPGGDLVVVHWRPAAGDTYLSGDAVQAWVRARPGWTSLITHQDEQFALDVLRRV